MRKRRTQRAGKSPDRSVNAQNGATADEVRRQIERVFSVDVVGQLRAEAGYNPRQRLVTAHRLMLIVVEAFLLGGSGGTLSFSGMRALFIRRFDLGFFERQLFIDAMSAGAHVLTRLKSSARSASSGT